MRAAKNIFANIDKISIILYILLVFLVGLIFMPHNTMKIVS